MEYAYYAKLIKDGFHTQCALDLESGAVKIQDVPFEFRNTEAYEAAHLYARTIKDEKERHDAYWQIQKQLESDIVQCEAEHQWRHGGKHIRQAIMSRDTSCFVLEERTDALMATYDFLFMFSTSKFCNTTRTPQKNLLRGSVLCHLLNLHIHIILIKIKSGCRWAAKSVFTIKTPEPVIISSSKSMV